MTESHVYKVCFNRGNARIWIEGNRLVSHGITRGAVYVKRFVESSEEESATLFLVFDESADGRKVRVAGTESRPIIDICSREISDFLAGAESYRATFGKQHDGKSVIMVEPA